MAARAFFSGGRSVRQPGGPIFVLVLAANLSLINWPSVAVSVVFFLEGRSRQSAGGGGLLPAVALS